MNPSSTARVAGAFYLADIVTGAIAGILVAGHQHLFGDVFNVVATAAYVVVTMLLYQIFKPVSATLSLLAAFFSLVGCATGNLAFFGFYCLLIGYLVFRSTFRPRAIGVLMAIAGLGWLTFLWPALSADLMPYNLAPGIIGEAALTFWLLIAGLNVTRWRELASR